MEALEVILEHGKDQLDLNDLENFIIEEGFAPPDVAASVTYSQSTSANRYTGGSVIDESLEDRGFSFGITVLGGSEGEIGKNSRRLREFLRRAGARPDRDLILRVRGNASVPEPIWGQHGAALRYKIKAGGLALPQSWGSGQRASGMVEDGLVALTLGPTAEGLEQRAAQAKGAVYEDYFGNPEGVSRGTMVGPAETNVIPNTSFETDVTGWTATGCTLERTDEQAFVGSYGMRQIVSTTNTTATAHYVGVVTGAPVAQDSYCLQAEFYAPAEMVGQTIGVFISELGGASATENTALSTVTAVAGWNFVHTVGTVKKADRTSLRAYLYIPAAATIEIGSWVIWDAVDMFVGDAARPHVDGDQIGCVWTGTAHASTSTSTVGYLRIALADLPRFSVLQGAICVAVKHRAARSRGTSGYLFSDGGNFYAAFANATDKWLFTDGTNSEGSGGAAQTFVPGDIDIVHFIWGPGRLEIYLNGVLYDGGTAFTPWTLGTHLYIGCSHLSTLHYNGLFMNFTIWNVSLSAAQIAKDYGQVNSLVRGGDGKGQRLSGILYQWTKDGDDIYDNCLDSTHAHYGYIGGVQGSYPAKTKFYGLVSGSGYKTITMSNLPLFFTDYASGLPAKLFADLSAVTAADMCGGEYYTASMDDDYTALGGGNTIGAVSTIQALIGREAYVYSRYKDSQASENINFAFAYSMGSTLIYSRDRLQAISNSAYRLHRTPPMALFSIPNEIDDEFLAKSFVFTGFVKRENTSSNAFYVDYSVLMPRPLMVLNNVQTAITEFRAINGEAIRLASGEFATRVSVKGDLIEFEPERINLLQILMGDESTDPLVASTCTLKVWITPRYALI